MVPEEPRDRGGSNPPTAVARPTIAHRTAHGRTPDHLAPRRPIRARRRRCRPRHRRPPARWVEGFLLRRADTVIAISDELATTAQDFGVRPERIHVIENWAPIDEVPLHPRDNPWSRAHGLGDRPRLLYSGTLARKHTPEALAELAAASPDTDVIVVSEGVGADWLTTESTTRGLTNLRVLPFQPFESLPEVLASGDILVALLTNDAAARMITERAGAGLIVEPGDIHAFVAAAQSLLADASLRARMGATGRQFAEATFSRDRIAEQLLTITNR